MRIKYPCLEKNSNDSHIPKSKKISPQYSASAKYFIT